MQPTHRGIRFAGAIIVAAGILACAVSILAEQLGLGADAARGMFGWKRVTLLATGLVIAAIGALIIAHPAPVSRRLGLPWPRARRALAWLGEQARRWRTALIASGVAALAAFIPRAMTTGHFQSFDEILWMERSQAFSTALLELNLSEASATTGETATMPGVTTMWLGAIARAIWTVGKAMGIYDDQGSFATSMVALELAQLAVAAATSVLIGLFVLLAWRWAGAIAACAAGALLATEPFFVAHGAVIHTDALATMFGAIGVIVLLMALGVPTATTGRPRAAAVLAGLMLAGALLSKLSALLLAPGLAVIVAWALVRAASQARAQSQPILAAMRPIAGLVAIVLGAALATTLLAWPALWADPINQVRFLRASADLASAGHAQFFLGEVTRSPGPLYYLVVTPFRLTPWFLLAGVVAIAGAASRETRLRFVALAIVAVPVFVGLSLASKQIDRYFIAILPFAALAIGIGLGVVWRWLGPRATVRRLAQAGAGAAIALAFAHAAWVAPWGTGYFNPLLGGSQAAEKAILIGGRGGQELAGEIIHKREWPNCDITIAVLPAPIPAAYPCGSRATAEDDPEYAVIVIGGRQRFPDRAEAMRTAGRVVAEVEVRGVVYAEVIDRRQSPEPVATAVDP